MLSILVTMWGLCLDNRGGHHMCIIITAPRCARMLLFVYGKHLLHMFLLHPYAENSLLIPTLAHAVIGIEGDRERMFQGGNSSGQGQGGNYGSNSQSGGIASKIPGEPSISPL